VSTRRALGQAGFTLVELMVALVVSTVLVGLVLSIYTRMSLAYRSQQQISELQQILQAAQVMVLQDVRQAGYQIPKGFRRPGAPSIVQPAVQIVNSATAPDEIRVFYADASAQARVTIKPAPVTSIISHTVDDASLFQVGDVVLLVLPTTGPNPRGSPQMVQGVLKYYDSDGAVLANVATTEACVLQIASIAGTTITYSQAAPWGMALNSHCEAANANVTDGTLPMLYRFRGRAYRIDPARKSLSVLQMSPTGGLLANDWQDLGIGFTDFQVASRWFDLGAVPLGPQTVDTADIDTDPTREWYSGTYQQTLSTPYTGVADPPTTVALIEVTISFAVRTSRPVEGVATGATPAFIDAARVNNGQVGDRPSVPLSGVPDASRAEENRGNHIYRYTTARIDVRNVGVGL
jgi:prepilin-type N-terminal cleavage/methylation domain-containing protein